MEKSDIVIAVVVGLIAIAAIAGVVWLAFAGREALLTGNKLVNAGLTLWIANNLMSVILGIIVLSVALFGVVVYLTHFGMK